MKMSVPIEVLDENCRACPNFKLWMHTTHIVNDNNAIIGHIVYGECENLQMCREGTNANYQ